MKHPSQPASTVTVARAAAAALAFFLCGTVSAALFYDLVNPIDPMSLLALRATYLLPLPFGIFLWLLCYRRGSDQYALVAILTTVPVWIVARLLVAMASLLLGDSDRAHGVLERLPELPMCLGGLIGALGITLTSATCRKYLIQFRFLAGAALVGILAAIPFGSSRLWGERHSVREMLCFGIWQAGVGTYLFWVCRRQDSSALQSRVGRFVR